MSELQASETAAPTVSTVTDAATTPMLPEDQARKWKQETDASIKNRASMLEKWKSNVGFRVQKPYGGANEDDTAQSDQAIPEDWARTKQKQAQLIFNLPKIVAKAERPEFKRSAQIAQAYVNRKLAHELRAKYMCDEVLADAVNAAGIMVSKVGIDVRSIDAVMSKPRPQVPHPADPSIMIDDPRGPEQVPYKKPIYQGYYWKRISPAAFLWPAEFTGSDWDDAPWLGHESWVPLEEAKKLWPVLAQEDFKKVEAKPTLLSEDVVDATVKASVEGYVRVREIWYKAHLRHPEVVHPETIYKIVFVEGREQPVEVGPTNWQRFVDETPDMPPGPPDPATGQPTPGQSGHPAHFLGIRKLPIRVGTLAYVSDMAIPPSDSEAGRPQVEEMMKFRSQMLRQRDTSIPIRWYDANRLDETIANSMRDGTWNDMVPTNGPGDRVIGEVARASYPRENDVFYSMIASELDRSWSLSNNQLSTPNDTTRSATEVNAVQSAGMVRLSYEKDRVYQYITEGVEVIFGLMQLFLDRRECVEIVGEDGAAVLQEFQRQDIAGDIAWEFIPDSGDRIEVSKKQENCLKLFNLIGKSPVVRPGALEEELIILHGYDPAKIIAPPSKPTPPPPNVSFRFAGDDLTNPIALAVMLKAHPDITDKDIMAAATMIKDAMLKIQIAQPLPNQPGGPGDPGAGGAPGGPPPMMKTEPEPPETPTPILKRAVDGSHL